MRDLVCDFCNRTPITWCYPATDFVLDFAGAKTHIEIGSDGGWAACDDCHEAIERSGVYGSAQRTVQSMGGDIVPSNIGLMVLALHKQFFAHRTGPATPHKE